MSKKSIGFIILLTIMSMLMACGKDNGTEIKTEGEVESQEQSDSINSEKDFIEHIEEDVDKISQDVEGSSEDQYGVDLTKLDTSQFDESRFDGKIRFNRTEFEDYNYTGDLFELSELTVDNILDKGYVCIPQYSNDDFDFETILEAGEQYSSYVRKYSSDDDFISGHELVIMNFSESSMTVRECIDANMFYLTDEGNMRADYVLNNIPEDLQDLKDDEAPSVILEVLGQPSYVALYDDIGHNYFLCYEYEDGTLVFNIAMITYDGKLLENQLSSIYYFDNNIWENVKTDYYEKGNPYFWN